ncbi:hypothetical protein JNB11_05315 [Kocuria palustris]|nr:hypothetical protein [Kocuria palustris]
MPPRIRRRITTARREQIEEEQRKLEKQVVRPFDVINGLPVSFKPPGDYDEVLKQPLTVKDSGVLYRLLLKSRYNYANVAPMFRLHWLRQSNYQRKMAELGKEIPEDKENPALVGGRQPVLGYEVSARDSMVKLHDATLTIGPHNFEVRLFIAKDARSDKKELEAKKEEAKLLKKDQKKNMPPSEAGPPRPRVASVHRSTLSEPVTDPALLSMAPGGTRHQPAKPAVAQPPGMDSPDNVVMISNLNAIARTDELLNALMKVVALGKASAAQIVTFQEYIKRAKDMGPQPHHAHLYPGGVLPKLAVPVNPPAPLPQPVQPPPMQMPLSGMAGTQPLPPRPEPKIEPPPPAEPEEGEGSDAEKSDKEGSGSDRDDDDGENSKKEDSEEAETNDATPLLATPHPQPSSPHSPAPGRSKVRTPQLRQSSPASPVPQGQQGGDDNQQAPTPAPKGQQFVNPNYQSLQNIAPGQYPPGYVPRQVRPQPPRVLLKLPRDKKLTAFQERYLHDATLVFEFVENANVRFQLPKWAITEVIEPETQTNADENGDNLDTRDIIWLFFWIHNQHEFDVYEEKKKKYDDYLAEVLRIEKEAADKEAAEKEAAEKEAAAAKEAKEGEDDEDDNGAEPEEEVAPLPKRRGGRKPPPRRKPAKGPKRVERPVEPEARYTPVLFTIHGIPFKYVPMYVNLAYAVDKVQAYMQRIMDTGVRTSPFYLWYQVDGKLDERVAELVRQELVAEEKRLPGAIDYIGKENEKKRKAKEKADMKKKIKMEEQAREIRENRFGANQTPPGTRSLRVKAEPGVDPLLR